MALKQVIEAHDLLSQPKVSGRQVADLLQAYGASEISVETVKGERTSTDFVSCLIPGQDSAAPTLGVIGRLGGVGARPDLIGLVSDADGAIAAIAAALKLADMARMGDVMPGPVRVHTHVCPDASTKPNIPVPQMRGPLPMFDMMKREVHPDMAAILSLDTSRGNRIINHNGIALTPTIKEGYILRVPETLLDLLSWTTGELPHVMPLTTVDITPSDNGMRRLNSIVQPATFTKAPVVGVAFTAIAAVPGCATGATNSRDLEAATRFTIEVAKVFGKNQCKFYDEAEWAELQRRYGSLRHLQQIGGGS